MNFVIIMVLILRNDLLQVRAFIVYYQSTRLKIDPMVLLNL